jgi:hypothetical protein
MVRYRTRTLRFEQMKPMPPEPHGQTAASQILPV